MARNIVVDTSSNSCPGFPRRCVHEQARATHLELLEQDDRLFTNSYVLVESSALIHRRLGFEPLREFIRSIQGVWEILWIDRSTHERIWSRMIVQGGARLSLVDHSVILSAADARAAIFTFDSDFVREGLTVVPAQIR